MDGSYSASSVVGAVSCGAVVVTTPVMGAYSELWAGSSSELTLKYGVGEACFAFGTGVSEAEGDLVIAMRGREDAGLLLRYCYDQIEELM